MILFVGCNKDSEQLFFSNKKKTHRTRSALHFTACVFNNRCVSSVLFQLFFHITHEGIHDHRLPAVLTLTQLLAVTRVFVFFHLISHSHFSQPNFTNCKLQNTRTHGCGVLRSTRELHTMLNRPGIQSNRLGPNPDPADHLKDRPEPVRVLGSQVLREDL